MPNSSGTSGLEAPIYKAHRATVGPQASPLLSFRHTNRRHTLLELSSDRRPPVIHRAACPFFTMRGKSYQSDAHMHTHTYARAHIHMHCLHLSAPCSKLTILVVIKENPLKLLHSGLTVRAPDGQNDLERLT